MSSPVEGAAGSGFFSPVRQPRLARENLPHVPRTRQVCLALRQRPSRFEREVRRLTEYQELVECVYTEARQQLQPDGQPNAAQKIHRFVGREAASVPQRSIGAPKLVLNNITGVAQQYMTGFLLLL